MQEISTFLYIYVFKVACIYSPTLVESHVLIKVAALNSDIDLTLYVNCAPIISATIYKLRVLYSQADIARQKYKSTHLITLATIVCNLCFVVRTGLR